MAGQRNSKMIRTIVAGILLFLALYVLYGYRNAVNESASKTHRLKLSQEEMHSLNKRFDMLSNELKGEVLFN